MKLGVHNINPLRSLLILVVWQDVWWWVLTISFPRWLCVTCAVSRTLGATSPWEQKWIKKFIQADRWTDRQTRRECITVIKLNCFPRHTHIQRHRLTWEDLAGNTKCCGYSKVIEKPSQRVTSYAVKSVSDIYHKSNVVCSFICLHNYNLFNGPKIRALWSKAWRKSIQCSFLDGKLNFFHLHHAATLSDAYYSFSDD